MITVKIIQVTRTRIGMEKDMTSTTSLRRKQFSVREIAFLMYFRSRRRFFFSPYRYDNNFNNDDNI